MALSTTRTLLTQTGINTHQVFDIGGLDSVGVATFSNFKTGSTNVHSVGVEAAGINVLGGDTPIGSGSTIYDDGGARFSGVVTATSFHGDISQATGAAAGLGTALSQTQTDPLNKVYYTNKVLSISTTTTIDHPATANLAYTQYGDIKIEDGHDLIIKTDDDFKYDILGISTTKIPSNQFSSGLSGDLTGNVTGNADTATTLKSNSSVSTSGIITASSFVGDVTGNVTGNTTGIVNTDRIIPTGGVPTGGGGGIVQVKQAVKTDSSFNTSSTSFIDITGLSVSITPTRSDSKILIFMDVKIGTDTNYVSGYVRMVRDSTPIYIGDDAGTSATRATAGMADDPNNQFPYQMTGQFLDSPATTSATTYKIQIKAEGPSGNTGTVRVNRATSGSGNQDVVTASSITVMEVSG